MDLALYRGAMLLVYVEVKQRADQLHELIKGIRRYEGYVDLGAPDRGNDSLRKAKSIVKYRPAYLSAVALGVGLEYRVDYPAGRAFHLAEDLIL